MSYPTIKEIAFRVREIAEMAGDDESAHSAEDSLHQDVLATIANGEHDDSAADMAREALRTRDIKFSRWCA